jgi:hypothetical protein
VSGETAPPGAEAVDHLSDFRGVFSEHPDLEQTLRNRISNGKPMTDGDFARRLEEGNASWMQRTTPQFRQKLASAGLLNDPDMMLVALGIADDVARLVADNDRQAREIARLRGAQLGAPPASHPPGSRNVERLDVFAVKEELGRLTDRLTSGKLGHEDQQAALTRIEQLQQRLYRD